ncbi:aminodeoxychorismate synthase component I [Pseudomonadota bacterium]
MTQPIRQQLPYHPDSAQLFAAIRNMPWAVFLDSGRPQINQGRYDILAADPIATLVTQGQQTHITDQSGSRGSTEDPFVLLQAFLQPRTAGFPDLPFCGGAIGYFGYELGQQVENITSQKVDTEQLPEMAIGIYDWALVVDHQKQQSWLVGAGQSNTTQEKWNELAVQFSQPTEKSDSSTFHVKGEIKSNITKQQYAAGFEKIQRYIHDGDCYQVNFSQCFSVPAKGDPWIAYQALRKSNPAPYAAYLNTPFSQILSCSPELFLQVQGNVVKTKPIKGTLPRGANKQEDEQLIQELIHSNKNRAENLMIVDLLRNDLGKSCKIGSIHVPEIFQIESFATVHHLVSTVTGMLAPNADAVTLLRGCFPGGSITGAPKHRAVQIIEELESHRREVYCGSIGYIGFDGNMQTNIAIRTLTASEENIKFCAGGGIVADSNMEDEYQEIRYKAAAMFELLACQKVYR